MATLIHYVCDSCGNREEGVPGGPTPDWFRAWTIRVYDGEDVIAEQTCNLCHGCKDKVMGSLKFGSPPTEPVARKGGLLNSCPPDYQTLLKRFHAEQDRRDY